MKNLRRDRPVSRGVPNRSGCGRSSDACGARVRGDLRADADGVLAEPLADRDDLARVHDRLRAPRVLLGFDERLVLDVLDHACAGRRCARRAPRGPQSRRRPPGRPAPRARAALAPTPRRAVAVRVDLAHELAQAVVVDAQVGRDALDHVEEGVGGDHRADAAGVAGEAVADELHLGKAHVVVHALVARDLRLEAARERRPGGDAEQRAEHDTVERRG